MELYIYIYRYLVCWAHEDVVGNLPEGQSQIDDIALCAATFWEVADMDNTSGRGFSGWKRLEKTMKHKNIYITMTQMWKIPPNFREMCSLNILVQPFGSHVFTNLHPLHIGVLTNRDDIGDIVWREHTLAEWHCMWRELKGGGTDVLKIRKSHV